MALSYRLRLHAGPDGRPRWQADARCPGEVSFEELAADIEKQTTASRADIVAVLAALSSEASRRLRDGYIVRLGDLGTLRPTLSAPAAASKEDFEAVRARVRVRFKPGRLLRRALLDARIRPASEKAAIPSEKAAILEEKAAILAPAGGMEKVEPRA